MKLLAQRERFFAEVNSVTFKNILLTRINKLVDKIDNMNIMTVRTNLLSTLYGLENLSQKELNSIHPFADIFFCKKDRSVPSLRLLRQGLDIDLSFGKGYSFETMTYKLQYLESYNSSKKDFFASKLFADLELETLIRHLERLTGFVTSLEFYKTTEFNKDIIDNPLKVLDFIKDIHNPEYKCHADFIKFQGQYLDSSILFDKPLGFKPKFDFDPRNRKVKISINVVDSKGNVRRHTSDDVKR